jgi:hypothetical protein
MQAYQGFRPPYADENVKTGYSGVVLKPAVDYYDEPHDYRQDQRGRMDEFEHAEIEPTETDIANLDDMDEATATNTQKLRPQASQP